MTVFNGRLAMAAALVCLAGAASADPSIDMVEPVTRFQGEMAAPMPGSDLPRPQVDNTIRFEPVQNFEDMFLRDDVVYLMRHGPTDWDKLDVPNVAPDECADQRILSPQGEKDMRDLGTLLAYNEIRFGRIVVSQWCRNQQTYDALLEGYDAVKPGIWSNTPVETDPELNLLLSLQGAESTTELRRLVSEWDGEDADGPLLIISHFTNIQELTEFAVYEGEIIVLDPDRNNRVLGYMRLKTAGPDVGHFDIDAADPLLNRETEAGETPRPN
ncbi:hypothetical protein E2L08_14925 [Palleronia sediminis]|uniref:Histidine phosphatase superfamily (Branch 1) n=1 Tax=Palleronia sediminis TaxID=2547833 RepID=A0A4R5ZY50_9RHOB|nr:phosphoglycerate mutase family protein [Palleronia sediminis]TDL75205.1 hypothetical protein E2L08_14925 [Palleronia sediminis]